MQRDIVVESQTWWGTSCLFWRRGLSCHRAPITALLQGEKNLHGSAVSAVLSRFDSFITSDNDLKKS
jgi:hypothetical protein